MPRPPRRAAAIAVRRVARIAVAATAAMLVTGAGPIDADIAAMRAFVAAEGERLWPGYAGAPFGMLLVAADGETLMCDDRVPAGFTAASPDPATACRRATRPRGTLPAGLLAAMPMFGPPATIVMGTPEATGLSRGRWASTILHEHFHQWQAALPDYYARVAALDLARGDTSGMWMIAYPIPYDSPATAAAHAAAARMLGAAIAARGTARFGRAFAAYRRARARFAATLSPADRRYVEFQLWQEGVARWTETVLGARHPDRAVREAAAALEAKTLAALAAPDLARTRREFAYPMGAGEAMLLEACGGGWRARYPHVLALGPLLDNAARRCRRR